MGGQQWPVTVGKKDPKRPQPSPRTPRRKEPVLARPERRNGPMERPDPADHVGDVEGSNSPIVPPALAFPVEMVGGSNSNPPNQVCHTHQVSEDRSVRRCYQVQGAKETIYWWILFLGGALTLSGTVFFGFRRFLVWFRRKRAQRGDVSLGDVDLEAGGDEGDGGDGVDEGDGGDGGDEGDGGDGGDGEAPSYIS